MLMMFIHVTNAKEQEQSSLLNNWDLDLSLKLKERHSFGFSIFSCEKCNGRGKIVKSVCPFCSGKKTSVDEDSFTLAVERGMPDGHSIVFEQVKISRFLNIKEADEAPEITPGDVIFKIKTVPHPRFERRGDDLHIKMNITLLEVK